ncbi:response regulator [Maribacter arcticus]|uniref:cAMP-binding domain of CRP or a regulatory subunit of cAMP-dependent protein kinases n=1 Tax=Maribacter arcticus TaxID=561365 RepID=A0A1T5CHW0_9FLAO|nr:response regulator [Maribacter arcticus]SKB59085.1 cAMP-binding domain of CRP or a regulatory subunit of cAMP-dependent protein kinases [Maribacter arcticus]
MKKILLIEDDTVLRENTAELLEFANYKVQTAANGRHGTTMALAYPPDIIVCDIMMPELDGYGVLQELASDESTRNIPFIFLSAKTEQKEIRRGMDMGADDYLTKPFDEQDLISAVESRLAKAELLGRKPESILKNRKSSEQQIRTLNELKNFFDDYGEIENFKEEENIYREGRRSSKLYLILKGIVKCHKIDENGKELITSLHPTDDFLGFTSFLDNVPYEESATAIEDVELAGISKEKLKAVLEENHAISLELIRLLTEDITEIKEQLLQMAYSSVRKKTALTLLQFAEIINKKPGDPIKVSRNDLASVTGIAPESFIRTLSGFKKEGLIVIEGRNIRIVDLQALKFVD